MYLMHSLNFETSNTPVVNLALDQNVFHCLSHLHTKKCIDLGLQLDCMIYVS